VSSPNPVPIYSGATPDEVAADLAHLVDFQPTGLSLAELKTLIADRLLPHLMHYDQPGFQSMFNAFPAAEARLGGEIGLAYNQGVTNWQVSPGGAMLEQLCGQALCRLFGLGPGADATFMYSGTYGNQQALYLALHRYAQRQGFDLAQKGIAGFVAPQKLAVLAAESAHFSLKHAIRMLGLGEECLVTLPVDDHWRLDVDALCETVQSLRLTRRIVAVVVTAGTTSAGAVDPIASAADVCAEEDIWLHVDGAYGYAYKLVPEWTHRFAGDQRADSIVWDPHKQLGAPIPNSLLFLKRRTDFARISLHSHYFNRPQDVVPNPGLKSPPSTRPMSALPLVAILRGQGLDKVIAGLRAHLEVVRDLADFLQTLPDVELCHRPDTGILCFRLKPPNLTEGELDDLQWRLYNRVMASGRRAISITRLGQKNVLRLVVVSSQTTLADLQETIAVLRHLAVQVARDGDAD
jgi:L-2,4-diaminobutyrate decarboxylase